MQIILDLMADNRWQRAWNKGLLDPTLVRHLEVDYIRVFQQRRGDVLTPCPPLRSGEGERAPSVRIGAFAQEPQQAFVFALVDDAPAAVEALKTYLAANPERRAAFALDPGWRYRGLAGDSGFRHLVGAP
jgi:hypothetical protein